MITTIEGAPASGFSVAFLMVNAKVGDPVEVTYVRGGTSRTTTITLAEQP